MINIKIKNCDPRTAVVTDENGKEITGIESIVIDPILPETPMTATLKMSVNDLHVDAYTSTENMLEAHNYKRVGMALVYGNVKANDVHFIRVDNENPLIRIDDRLIIAGSHKVYTVTGIIRKIITVAELDMPIDSNIADNAVIQIYRKGDQ